MNLVNIVLNYLFIYDTRMIKIGGASVKMFGFGYGAVGAGTVSYTQLDVYKRQILDKTGKHVEVMVYGDGAFKDPQGKIWELADPVVSPAFTDGLRGTPNEVKLKYLADNDFKDLSGEALKEAISKRIKEKSDNLVGDMASQGTTPRQLTDLIGSLCDLTSGSGDKGTPVVLVPVSYTHLLEARRKSVRNNQL